MTETSPRTTPLSIYVVYHPDTPESRDLADQLHDWFRLVQDDGDDTEAGLPIWFRARLGEKKDQPEISPDIAWEAADLNVVVLLVDDRMVTDPRWRQALQALMTHRDGNLILPVAVDFSLYRLTFLYEKLNPIRIGDPRDRDEDENPGKEPKKKARKQRIAQRARLLRRAVTEAITRELQDRRSTDSAPVPMEVFLSHAKRDGIKIAEAIRDGLAGFSQTGIRIRPAGPRLVSLIYRPGFANFVKNSMTRENGIFRSSARPCWTSSSPGARRRR